MRPSVRLSGNINLNEIPGSVAVIGITHVLFSGRSREGSAIMRTICHQVHDDFKKG